MTVVPPLTLVTGPEELLADRAVAEVVAAARKQDPSVEICDVIPGQLAPGGFAELVSPSLFGEAKVVVVRGVQDLTPEQTTEVTRYLNDPADTTVLVLVHGGGVKGKAFLDAVKKRKPNLVDCPKLSKPGDRIGFIKSEFKRVKRAITDDAARALSDAVGSDLRELAAAASQLVDDSEGTVDETIVAKYYQGRAEVSGFAIADLAIEGRRFEALEQLRFALDTGVAPVLIVSAFATGLRRLGKVAAAGGAAKDLGLPPWQIDKLRKQARSWNPPRLSAALRAVADTDAAVKGAAADPYYALEKLVLSL
ncbi:DNA polymerase III subunit delta [Actinospica sp.]|uniref:DNA polymerase III subunit delta n=1 Tax=Actinospica sp. TaxID=1872142 RepID=UPI002BDD5DC1|nr:DNA polymerase III subunit delta [Actinospica sp.]HWG27304.1 DNA polymerase III subunit delta [Actinospica sp.]